ncbi:hypothetical protein pb186bvf_013298 [Paramecium bursaria]
MIKNSKTNYFGFLLMLFYNIFNYFSRLSILIIFNLPMDNLRPHINEVRIQLLLDDLVKALTTKNFQISVLNSLVDRDMSEKFHQPWNLQTPKVVNAPYFMRANSIDKFSINTPLTSVFKSKKQVTQSQQSLDANTTCTSLKKANFNFSLITDQLNINLTQFKKDSETIKLVDSVTYDIGVSHISNFVQKRVICNVLRKKIKMDGSPTCITKVQRVEEQVFFDLIVDRRKKSRFLGTIHYQ